MLSGFGSLFRWKRNCAFTSCHLTPPQLQGFPEEFFLLFLLSVPQTKEVRLFSWLTSFYLYFVFKTHRRIASTSFRFQQFWSKALRHAAVRLVDNLKFAH